LYSFNDKGECIWALNTLGTKYTSSVPDDSSPAKTKNPIPPRAAFWANFLREIGFDLNFFDSFKGSKKMIYSVASVSVSSDLASSLFLPSSAESAAASSV